MNDFFHCWLESADLMWCPRLTAGIYAVTRVLGAKRVVVPNNCCLNVVYGILLADAEPILCEIDLENGGLSAEACEALLTQTSVDMVVHIHLFGLYHQRETIHRLCQNHGAFFFEDAALWFPPYRGYEVATGGCLGLSFGSQKTFDFGTGALVGFADRKLAAEVRRYQAHAPARPTTGWDYLQAFHQLAGWDYRPKKRGTDFAFLARAYRDYWIGSCALPDIDLNESLVRETSRRRADVADSYARVVERLGVKFLARHPLDLPWRFTFLTKKADRMTGYLQQNGVSASQFYRPLDWFFPALRTSDRLENSHAFGSRVCNLPCDQSVTDDLLRRFDAVVRQMESDWSFAGEVSTAVRRGLRVVRKAGHSIGQTLRRTG